MPSFRQAMQEQMAKTDNAQIRGMMEQVVANLEFGATYPAFGTVAAGPDDTWLVRRPVLGAEVTAAMANLPALDGLPRRPESDVFDADGRFLGSIQLPAGFRLAAVAGGKLYGIETDSLDVPSVVRLSRTGDQGSH